MPRQIFVTTALPYANGAFHIGHIMEYIEADIWVRNLRMGGHTVHFVGADDAHGAPIMIAAQKAGITPEAFIAPIQRSRRQYLEGFFLSFDHWHSTHSHENTAWSQYIYSQLQHVGLIDKRTIEQYFDESAGMFLPDRFIKGECPNCHAADQYGDACEVCGAVYAATNLIQPRSVLSGKEPQLKTSEHYFFRLSDSRCQNFLRAWTQNGKLQPEVANKVKEWLGEGSDNKLEDWDISRDAPYFGIPIPGATNKYFYVWLDAPIGYLASLEGYFKQKKLGDVRAFLSDTTTEQYHFIGKDIIYFHTLFWPAMLQCSGLKPPTNVFVHGFITVSGEKMSKSRGTGISPLRYLELGLNPEWLRYYFAAKLNGKAEDIDFNSTDFINRINSDLIGKYINLASRASGFLSQHFGGNIGAVDNAVLAPIKTYAHSCSAAYEARRYALIVRETMLLADSVNQYFDSAKPWLLAKDPQQKELLHTVCSTTISAFRLLTLILQPILPTTAAKVATWLGVNANQWSDIEAPLHTTIAPYQHLLQRVDEPTLSALFHTDVATTKGNAKSNAKTATTNGTPVIAKLASQLSSEVTNKETGEDTISIDDFVRIDMRVAKVLECSTVEGSSKLLKFTLDVGEPNSRTVFSGIALHYPDPQALVGRLVIVVKNLAPRKMRFGVSEGMILSASGSDGVFMLEVDSRAYAGMKIS